MQPEFDKRPLGRTGLLVSPIAIGGAAFAYVQRSRGWDPRSDDGRALVAETVNAALDAGINYVDTAAAYGDGYSETLIGQVMRDRRDDCVLASKVWFESDAATARQSVTDSLRRLQSDHIDILQIHGRMYSARDVDRITNGGLLDELVRLRSDGLIGHIGITTEEPWSVIPFLTCEAIDVYQIAYNLIYQAAARHFLLEAQAADVGVVTMRTMTSGVFQRQMHELAPEWQSVRDLHEVALKFVLSDSRIHSGIIGMRWPDEVRRNVELIAGWTPSFEVAEMPRLTMQVYGAEDADAKVSS